MLFSLLFKKWGLAFGLMVLLLGLGYGIGRAPVWASHGCDNYWHNHWYRNSSFPTKRVVSQTLIVQPSGGTYAPYIVLALDDWDTSQTYVNFDVPGSGEPVDTYIIVDQYAADPAWGWVQSDPTPCGSVSSHLSWADVYMNSSTIEASIRSGRPETLRRKVATHELGHSVGLGHPSDSSVTAVMKQGWNGYYTIQTWDKNMLSANSDPYGHNH